MTASLKKENTSFKFEKKKEKKPVLAMLIWKKKTSKWIGMANDADHSLQTVILVQLNLPYLEVVVGAHSFSMQWQFSSTFQVHSLLVSPPKEAGLLKTCMVTLTPCVSCTIGFRCSDVSMFPDLSYLYNSIITDKWWHKRFFKCGIGCVVCLLPEHSLTGCILESWSQWLTLQ